jgi:ubiquinone/menaquinone biosynthesis C-methylase UbiE
MIHRLKTGLLRKVRREEAADGGEQDLLRQARRSGDPFKGGPYYDLAETDMDWQWEQLIWPMISGLDFAVVVDLAAGHGRNAAKLLQVAKRVILVDINQECLDFCMARFQGDPRVEYVRTDGISLRGLESESVTLVYTFDAMVHFDSDVVRAYLREIHRVLKPGGHAFCHHSNYQGSPEGDFTEHEHYRNFMSKALFAHYSAKEGLEVVRQQVIDWSVPELDCLSLVRKPR